MLVCDICDKGARKIAFSRHKKGSSGAGGTWALRAPIHSKTQRPNLHAYKGMKFCTKCLRMVKKTLLPVKPQEKPAAASEQNSVL